MLNSINKTMLNKFQENKLNYKKETYNKNLEGLLKTSYSAQRSSRFVKNWKALASKTQ